MPDPQDTTQDPALDNPNPQDNPPADPPVDPKAKPFTPEQEQYLGSWFGRIVSKQIEDKVLPMIKEHQPPPRQSVDPSSDQVKQFNDEIINQLLTDPVTAFQRLMQVHENAKTILSKDKTTKLQKAYTTYAEQPLYKEVFDEMKQFAEAAVKEGYPPEAAAEYGYYKAKANYFEREKGGGGGDDEGSFGNMGGGINKKEKKKAQLPERFKDAARRDIAAGIFKDEAEYISSLHPSIRQQYGI